MLCAKPQKRLIRQYTREKRGPDEDTHTALLGTYAITLLSCAFSALQDKIRLAQTVLVSSYRTFCTTRLA